MTDRPYTLVLGQRLEVEIVQPDGGRAIVVGQLDGVPLAGGGQALTIRIVADEVRVGEAEARRPASSPGVETNGADVPHNPEP